MFDLLLTLALVYFGYRIYNWYSNQKSVGAPPPRDTVRPGHDEPLDVTSTRSDDDYIDYEEVK